MRVDVFSKISEASSDDVANKTVIVVDVLRATSTIVTALAYGASCIVPVETIQQARQMQAAGDQLGGERNCQKIHGFDYGNSPLEYRSSATSGCRIILTTTNGTRAIQKARSAKQILAGSFLNARACARRAADLKEEIAIICAGTHDIFSLEDGLCAGLLVRELLQLESGYDQINDTGLAMMYAFTKVEEVLEETILQSANGRKLTRMGSREDVSFCSQLNAYHNVPAMQGIEMS